MCNKRRVSFVFFGSNVLTDNVAALDFVVGL